MGSFNKVTLLGNVTRDLEVKFLPSGMAVLEMGIAVNDRVKKGETWADEPTFVDVTVFGKQAESSANFLSKGSQVLVEGRLKMDQWNDKTTGDKRTKLKVIANDVVFVGSKKDNGHSRGDADDAGGTFSQPVGASSSKSEDIPPWQ